MGERVDDLKRDKQIWFDYRNGHGLQIRAIVAVRYPSHREFFMEHFAELSEYQITN